MATKGKRGTRVTSNKARSASRSARGAGALTLRGGGLVLPKGRWTVMQFAVGASETLVEALIVGVVASAQGVRIAGTKWVAAVGELFEGEGTPVALLSPAVPKVVVDGLKRFAEVLGGARVRREEPNRLAFRGQTVVWIDDGHQIWN